MGLSKGKKGGKKKEGKLLLAAHAGHAATAGGLGVLATDLEAPVVSKTTVSAASNKGEFHTHTHTRARARFPGIL